MVHITDCRFWLALLVKVCIGLSKHINFMSCVRYCRFLVCVNRLPLTPNSNKFLMQIFLSQPFYLVLFCGTMCLKDDNYEKSG